MEKHTLFHLLYIIFILALTVVFLIQTLVPVKEKKIPLPKTFYVGLNSLGFRDREWNLEKNSNTLRIIVLGDTVTASIVELNETWPKQLEKKLNELNPALNFEVFNMAKGGWGTFEEVEAFKRIGLNFHPDIVILQYYPGDWRDPNITRKGERLCEEYKEGNYKVPPDIERLAEKHVGGESLICMFIAGKVQNDYFRRVNFEEEWERWVEKPLIELIEITKKKGIKLLVITWDMDELHEKEKLVSLLEKYEIPFYDFTKYLPHEPERISGDMVLFKSSSTRAFSLYLTPLGYEIVANKTIDALIKEKYLNFN